MGDKIQEGDLVDVFWENVECEIALKVTSVPCNPIDTWCFQRTTEDETVIYAGSFSKMVKRLKED